MPASSKRKPGAPTNEPSSKGGSGLSAKKVSFQCPICEDAIHDDTQASIFCSGPCNMWIHRGCAGLNPSGFTAAQKSGSFHCPTCRLSYQSHHIESLKQELAALEGKLSSEISELQSRIVSSSEELSSLSQLHSTPSLSYTPLPPLVLQQSPLNLHDSSEPQAVTTRPFSSVGFPRQFSVVVHGVAECSHGTSRSEQISSDFDSISVECEQYLLFM